MNVKTYENHVNELGYEIADDIIKKEENTQWEVTFYRDKVAKSLSLIYERDIKKVSDDLEEAIKRSTRKIKLLKTNKIEY